MAGTNDDAISKKILDQAVRMSRNPNYRAANPEQAKKINEASKRTRAAIRRSGGKSR